jgi:hypothetical protein
MTMIATLRWTINPIDKTFPPEMAWLPTRGRNKKWFVDDDDDDDEFDMAAAAAADHSSWCDDY